MNPTAIGHQFGGNWTIQKLDILAKYLERYTTALKNKPSRERPFHKSYIDAFAGTGYRDVAVADSPQGSLFEVAGDEPQSLLEGSTKLALRTEPPFDRYVFIERRADRCKELEALSSEFPDRRTQILHGEANAEIQRYRVATGVRIAPCFFSIPTACK